MASARRTGTSESISTYDSAGGKNYTSLQTWEAATDNDNVTGTVSPVLECYSGTIHADEVSIEGATNNATYFRIIRPASGEGHSGICRASTAYVSFRSSHVSRVFMLGSEQYTQVQDIVAETTGITNAGIFRWNATDCSYSAFVGCLAFGNAGGGNNQRGFFSFNRTDTNPVFIIDCAAQGNDSDGIETTAGLVYICNSTFESNDEYGISQNGGTVTAKNCICDVNPTADYSSSVTMTTCLSSDTSGSAGLQSKNPAYVSVSTGDLHLASGSDGIDSGTDLSADATYPFDDDVDKVTITGTWDCGYDEFVATAANVADITIPQLTINSTALLHATVSLNLPQLSVQGGSGATGNITFPILTLNAESLIHGNASLNLPAMSISSTATTIHADASLTLPALSVLSTSGIHAEASLSLPALTVNVESLTHGNSSLSLPVLTVSGDVLSLNNNANITLPQFTTVFAGHLAVDATITLPQLTVQGGSGATGNITLPLIAVASTTIAPTVNEASITLPAITVTAQAHLQADVSLTLPIFTIESFTGALASITLPQITIQGVTGASANITLPQLTITTAVQGGDITLPIFTIAARGVKGSVPDCVVMNTINNAVSEYKGYWFNSYTKFNGVYLAANQNGIYEQDDSDTDNAGVDDFKIKAHIKTGIIDTYQDRIQRLRNAWLTFRTDGDIRITTRADKQVTRVYNLTFQNYVGIKERRVKFERGIRQRHFDFKVQNINGSDLQVDKLTVTLEPIISKRR